MSNELAKTGSGALAEIDELQELLRQNAGSGLENIKAEDIILPRLAILQPTSPESSQDGYSAGDIVNKLTGENYGRSFTFFTLHYYPNRVLFESEDTGADIECRSNNGITGDTHGACATCQFSKWTEDNSGNAVRPRCTEFKNVVVEPANADDGFLEKSPIVFSAKRAALKPTNAFLSALFVARKPAYATKWTLTSERQQRDKLTWFTPKFTQGAPIETVDEFHALKALSDQIVASQSRFRVDQSDTDGVAAEDSEAF